MVEAITDSRALKDRCLNHAGLTCGKIVKNNYGLEGYDYGLCHTGVWRELGIPKTNLSRK